MSSSAGILFCDGWRRFAYQKPISIAESGKLNSIAPPLTVLSPRSIPIAG
jgi:hypothetical protein